MSKPVQKDLSKAEAIAEQLTGKKLSPIIDFSDTSIAFAHKTDKELKKMLWLFGLMNKHWLVGIGAKLGVAAIKMHLPFVESAVRYTIFEQFCGGRTLVETEKTIDTLYSNQVSTILDYGAEGKEGEEELNKTMNETIRAIQFGSNKDAVLMVSSKITGLARFDLLADIQNGKPMTKATRKEYKSVLKRMDAICHVAAENNTAVLFDAEETWIQDTIDHLVTVMMRRYNKKKAVVYNTYQMYRTASLQNLITAYDKATAAGYILGAKLVRGAYMEKERERAQKMGYTSPIHPDKNATDEAYDTALRFCLKNYQTIAICNATHNQNSNLLMAQTIYNEKLDKNHPHLVNAQLYGMSDNLTFNLAKAGYTTAKYVPYGQIAEVVPYLIRRSEENSSITGDMSREYEMVLKEAKRRGLER